MVRDETVYGPDGARFVLAFDIHEHTMMNETGRLAWARVIDGCPTIIGHPTSTFVRCWQRPFALWLTIKTVVLQVATDGHEAPIADLTTATPLDGPWHPLARIEDMVLTAASHPSR